jgi:hypothetical protein
MRPRLSGITRIGLLSFGSDLGGIKALSSSGVASAVVLRKVSEPASVASSFQVAVSSWYCCRSMEKPSILPSKLIALCRITRQHTITLLDLLV